MKKALSICLLLTLLFQSLAHFSVIALYELRKDFIARNLCENREDPASDCCGKCYLKKQLKKVDESNDDTKAPASKIEKQDGLAYILPQQEPLILPPCSCTEKAYTPGRQDMNGYHPLPAIFRPPIDRG